MSKYLIVDDDDNKAAYIQNNLVDFGVSEKCILRAKSYIGGMNILRSDKISLMILDLNLPVRDNGTPEKGRGGALLETLISKPEVYEIPQSIIGLTAYSDLKEEYESKFSSQDFSLWNYDEMAWVEILRNKLKWKVNSDSRSDFDRKSVGRTVVSVHGIRTAGQWQRDFEEIIEKETQYSYKSFNYGYFSGIKFLIPTLRKRIVKRFRDDIEYYINNNPGQEIIFFSHSFGTYILKSCLEKIEPSDCKINAIVLSGSVISEKYDWSVVKSRHSIEYIVNDCGFNDNVLLASKMFSPDMGMAGRVGFEGMLVENRYFKGGHSFISDRDEIMREFWLPVVDGQIRKINERDFSPAREQVEVLIRNFWGKRLALYSVFLTLVMFLFV